jgi:hypothetical protein
MRFEVRSGEDDSDKSGNYASGRLTSTGGASEDNCTGDGGFVSLDGTCCSSFILNENKRPLCQYLKGSINVRSLVLMGMDLNVILIICLEKQNKWNGRNKHYSVTILVF